MFDPRGINSFYCGERSYECILYQNRFVLKPDWLFLFQSLPAAGGDEKKAKILDVVPPKKKKR